MKQTIELSKNDTAKSSKLSVRNMAFIAVMAALICVAAPFSVPLPGYIPISLATFAVYLAGGVLGWKKGAAAVLVYILLGAVGLPVFSGGAGGFAKLFGVTGGYIFGYIPCVLLTGLFVDKLYKKRSNGFIGWLSGAWAVPAGMILGTAACYAFGTAWYIVTTGTELAAAIASCVVPFLVGDLIKIVCASALAMMLRDRLAKVMAGT